MIRPFDVVLAMSWSGETAELANIISYTRRFKVPLIAVTSNPDQHTGQAIGHSTLPAKGQGSLPARSGPDHLNHLAALSGRCDCNRICLKATDFTATDFKRFHPGGSLGANLQFVRDLMHSGDFMPLTHINTRMSEVIVIMSQKGFGCVGITDDDGALIGMVTDGDLRRHLSDDLLTRPVKEVMTPDPKTLDPDILVPAAIEMLNSSAITAIFVVEERRPIGILHMHDFLRIGAA